MKFNFYFLHSVCQRSRSLAKTFFHFIHQTSATLENFCAYCLHDYLYGSKLSFRLYNSLLICFNENLLSSCMVCMIQKLSTSEIA